jgi:hypothetical protein
MKAVKTYPNLSDGTEFYNMVVAGVNQDSPNKYFNAKHEIDK